MSFRMWMQTKKCDHIETIHIKNMSLAKKRKRKRKKKRIIQVPIYMRQVAYDFKWVLTTIAIHWSEFNLLLVTIAQLNRSIAMLDVNLLPTYIYERCCADCIYASNNWVRMARTQSNRLIYATREQNHNSILFFASIESYIYILNEWEREKKENNMNPTYWSQYEMSPLFFRSKPDGDR